MRPLNEDEAALVFQKLGVFLGEKVISLVEGGDSESYYFRLHKERVYYIHETVLKYSGCVNKKKLVGGIPTLHARQVSAGVCLGKFTKNKHFKLQITCLHYLAHYSKHKVWLKPKNQSFLYGNHVLKKHILQMSEDIPQNGGVVVIADDLPVGFGVTSKSTEHLKTSLPDDVAVFHQADIGEYLRHESEIV